MDEVKKKVYLDVFASPGTLLPAAAGITALIGSWAVDGNSTLTFLGISGVLTGVGVLATRLILGLDKITQRAYDLVLDRKNHEQQRALADLRKRLVGDRDPRTQACLDELRLLHSRMKDKLSGEPTTINSASYGVLEGVDEIFHTCVKQLEQSYELWETARTMRGSARQNILQQRDVLVQEICTTVDHLGRTVEKFHEVTTHKNRKELARLRNELDQSMQVAREVERQTEELTRRTYDEHEFE
ncbi:MAG: hypothetical protein KDB23_16265 [Planctomycetales bacterium]|nr:hypothetical protein [Planctomycetales bacterium]